MYSSCGLRAEGYPRSVRAPLPIDSHLPEILEALRLRRVAVVTAPPGSGKTTRVPPALLPLGPTLLLQPRRIAARSLARRIAGENGWRVGEEVGWQIRFERCFGPRTRLLVATEGVLTARLQSDPMLSGFSVVVLDEFHERTIHSDLGLAFLRQAMAVRDDLHVVVMSATLDPGPIRSFLGDCPVIDAPGRPFPVEVSHAPRQTPAEAVQAIVRRDGGHALVFLPGAPEIRRVEADLSRGALPPSVRVLPLHGSLDADAQDRALAPSVARKIILATNLAETSLTVEGVTDVVDSGLHKVLRFRPEIGLDRLETERISRDSAEQRAGRAGRTAPGRALRLWDSRDELRPHRVPEIKRVDLTGPFLDVLAWGADPMSFEWFDAPPREGADAALRLLEWLGAVESNRITSLGRALRRFPLHPRLAKILVEAGGTRSAVAACAVLAEAWAPGGEPASTDSDIVSRAEAISRAPESVRAAARQLGEIARDALKSVANTGEAEGRLLRALLAGFPDRVARRREPGSPRLILASGQGAALGRESGVRSGEWLVAIDARAPERGRGAEARVFAASRIEKEWLRPTGRTREHTFDAQSGTVRSFERELYGALVLTERPVPPDPAEAARLLAAALRERGYGPEEQSILQRARFSGLDWNEDDWIARACEGCNTLAEVDLLRAVPRQSRAELDRLAPETLAVPSGRRVRLTYRDGTVTAAVKLQELFGLADTPRIGPRNEPVTFSLLAPNGQPVQTTRDLRSFWERVYPEVRRELRGRYPKHPWPEDPWSAHPTHRTKGR